MVTAAGDHDAAAENLGTAATGMGRAQEQSELIANQIKSILDDAAAKPYPVQIDQDTDQVIPPNTDHLTDEAAAEVAAKVTALQERVAAVLAAGRLVDSDLAQAIRTASTTDAAATPAPVQIGPFPVPPAAAKPGDESPASPDSLDSALAQLTGQPVPASATDPAGGAAPVRLEPAKVEQFKALARQAMQRDGVPADQIETRLDAMVAAARQPLPAYKPTDKPGPGPTVSDGFADGWFNTEDAIKGLVGANGWEQFKDSWTGTAKGAWEQLTHPIDSLPGEVEHATKYPGHYVGEIAGETALTAPGALFGGLAALAARGAGPLDDLAAAGAHAHSHVPNDLIDSPTSTGAFDHHTPAPLGDSPSHHGTHVRVADATPGPLPADSPLFDGYDPTPPGPDFMKPDGGLIYPDDSLPSTPYAVPDTIIDNAELPQGTVIDRFGSPYGSWLSPDRTPFAERALPPDSVSKSYYRYVVGDPTSLPPGFQIEQSQVAPWFHQPGGGIQYRIIGPDGKDASVNDLLDSGYLKDIYE